LLAQLTSVKSLLLLRRSQLDMAAATPALQEAARGAAQAARLERSVVYLLLK